MLKRVLLLSLLSSTLIFANKIELLLPPFCDPLKVDPALPESFVMGSFHLPANLYAGVIWGEKQDLEQLFKNPSRICSTFIFVCLSGDVTQDGPLTFNNEMDICQNLQSRGFSEIEIKKNFWGSYPVLITQFINQERQIHLAWVGLNGNEGRWSLMFSFHYPDIQAKPSSEQLYIWKHFLAETAPTR
jgi:hypothetical protein